MRVRLTTNAFIASTLILAFDSPMGWAADYKIITDRKPCPGKERDAYKPYQGENPTESHFEVEDTDECMRLARNEVKILRKGTIGEKTVTATFRGKSAGVYSDLKKCN